jgi:AcrR family transcriptional regulator
MSSPADSSAQNEERPPLGLRERKKARTQAAIQAAALRLFRERGYEATTIEQIAEAAEVSPSTFFRYFPTKEDVVLLDLNDPLLVESFRAQPPELTPVQALRNAIREVFGRLSPEQIETDRQRQQLILANHELRARMLDEIAGMIDLIAELVAERAGRRPDELDVRVFAGALMGVAFGLMLTDPEASTKDHVALFEAGLEQLENGIRI